MINVVYSYFKDFSCGLNQFKPIKPWATIANKPQKESRISISMSITRQFYGSPSARSHRPRGQAWSCSARWPDCGAAAPHGRSSSLRRGWPAGRRRCTPPPSLIGPKQKNVRIKDGTGRHGTNQDGPTSSRVDDQAAEQQLHVLVANVEGHRLGNKRNF